MNEEPWSSAKQNERRARLYARHCRMLHRTFDEDGACSAEHAAEAADARVRAWHAFAAFAGSPADVWLGNAILRKTDFSPGYSFFVCGLAQLFVRHRALFEPDVLDRAERCLADTGEEQVESSGFVGMNTNFPSMDCVILILAGELTNRRALVDTAIQRMHEAVGRLDKDGTIAEFNSPTYTGLTLCCMADISCFAHCAEARELALRIEQQTWYDVCARFHPGTGQMGGPSSRSYMADSCGQLHNMRYVLYSAFGEEQCLSAIERAIDGPEEGMRDPDPRLIVHHDDIRFVEANGMWLAAAEYHPTDEAGHMMVDRPLPFEVNGTASCAFRFRPDDYRYGPAGREPHRFRPFVTTRFAPALLTTYHTADYSLATSSGALACGGGGQHDAFLLAYRRSRTDGSAGMADYRTAFCRYVLNERQPHGTELFFEQGHKACVQKGGTALVLYRPDLSDVQSVTSMRLCIVLPLHFSEPEQVLIGEEPLADLEGAAVAPAPVFVRDGVTMLAFRPLALTDYGREQAVVIRRVERFLTINFYNYSGPERSINFPPQAAPFIQNGFAVEVAADGGGGAFDAFRAAVTDASVEDAFAGEVRGVQYRRGGRDVRIEWDPADCGCVPSAWIDGEPRSVPRFEATGLPGLPW